jgi:hypothetical protein
MLCSLISQYDLPHQVQRAFLELMRVLYVDRYPHESQRLPVLNWTISDLVERDVKTDGALAAFSLSETHQLRASEDPFYSFPSATKFYLVNNFVTGYFTKLDGQQVIGQKNENDLTSSVLAITGNLIDYGFFGTEEEIEVFLDTVVNALDGRNDTVYEASSNPEARRMSVNATKIHADIVAGSGQLQSLHNRASMVQVTEAQKAAKGFIENVIKRVAIGNVRHKLNGDSLRVMDCKVSSTQPNPERDPSCVLTPAIPRPTS